ncbi:MAG: ABC transporter ATP-binding protein [Candidatus Bathyarchaeota archaeon]|nr:ABC transporter ATP-binding protein [Candidatus Bathyarchaeota archaeon]
MSSIETEGLTKRFGSLKAVDQLSFEVGEGEVFGLLGPNGAGKTTTVRVLACLISPSEGSARVGGYDIRRDPMKVRQTVGILTENPSLYERLTAYENMDFFAEAYGLSGLQEKRDRIRELLEFFGLWERRNDKVVTFSKGMKQKLAIARAIVHNPPILFLDEPTAGLDPESAKGIRDLMKRLSAHEKHTILLCTHRLEDAEKLCSRVMIIKRGKSVVVGTPEALRDKIAGQPVLEVRLKKSDQKIVEAVRELEEVREIDVDDSATRLLITVDDVKSAAPEVVRRIVYADGMVFSVNILRPSLEEAYLKLVREERG